MESIPLLLKVAGNDVFRAVVFITNQKGDNNHEETRAIESGIGMAEKA
jgi:hypothetical protein